MGESLIKIYDSIKEKIKDIAEAIEKADATTEEYHKLLVNFNDSMATLGEINAVVQNIMEKKEDENV